MAKNFNWTKNLRGSWEHCVEIVKHPDIPEPEGWDDKNIRKLLYIYGGGVSVGAIKKPDNNIEIAIWEKRKDRKTDNLIKKLNLFPVDQNEAFVELNQSYNAQAPDARVLGINPTFENISFNNYTLNLYNLQKLTLPNLLIASAFDSLLSEYPEFVCDRTSSDCIDLLKEKKELNLKYTAENLPFRRNHVILPGDIKGSNFVIKYI